MAESIVCAQHARGNTYPATPVNLTLKARARQKAIEMFGIDPDATLPADCLSPEHLVIVRQAQWHVGCAAYAALGCE